MKNLILLLLVISLASPVSAEIYKWLDENGNSHYTDDFTQIPDIYRSKLERVESGEPAESTKKESETPGVAPKEETAVKDRLGRGEEYWRGRVGELKGRIAALQEKDQSLRSRYNELTERYNDSKSSIERARLKSERGELKSQMDQIKVEIEDTKIVLERKIREEAEFYRANPDWIK